MADRKAGVQIKIVFEYDKWKATALHKSKVLETEYGDNMSEVLEQLHNRLNRYEFFVGDRYSSRK